MAITKEQVKKDLEEIKQYYMHKAIFDKAIKTVGVIAILEKVSRYNKLMASAPSKVSEIYYLLYVDGQTYEAAAVTLDCTPVNIYYRAKRLWDYLTKHL